MSQVIDDLVQKLKTAQRKAAAAKRDYDDAQAVASERRAELQQADAIVDELERAISLLRNGLRPAVVETGNVTRLK